MLYSKEFIKDDKTKIIVRFDLREEKNTISWKVYDIQYKKPRQKEWRYLKDSFGDDYSYRHLSTAERTEYEYNQFKEFCGEDILKAAYQDIYDRIKPEVLND